MRGKKEKKKDGGIRDVTLTNRCPSLSSRIKKKKKIFPNNEPMMAKLTTIVFSKINLATLQTESVDAFVLLQSTEGHCPRRRRSSRGNAQYKTKSNRRSERNCAKRHSFMSFRRLNRSRVSARQVRASKRARRGCGCID